MNVRYLAHHVIYRGVDHGLAVLEITQTADGTHHIEVKTFTREVHSTAFHSGTITVTDSGPEPKLIFE